MVLCGSIWFQTVPHGPTWFHIFLHVDNEDKKGVCNRVGCFIWFHPAASPVQGGHLASCASMLAVTRLLPACPPDIQIHKCVQLYNHTCIHVVVVPSWPNKNINLVRENNTRCTRAQSLGLACPLDQHCQ